MPLILYRIVLLGGRGDISKFSIANDLVHMKLFTRLTGCAKSETVAYFVWEYLVRRYMAKGPVRLDSRVLKPVTGNAEATSKLSFGLIKN